MLGSVVRSQLRMTALDLYLSPNSTPRPSFLLAHPRGALMTPCQIQADFLAAA